MKTKSLLRKVMMITVFALAPTFFSGLSSLEASSKAQNGGVSYGQAVMYLQSCSHQHTVNSIQLIPGTNNYQASVDGGAVAIVNVANGSITGHSDTQSSIVIHDNSGG